MPFGKSAVYVEDSGPGKSYNWVKTGFPQGIYLAGGLNDLKSTLYCIGSKRA
jgi:hypothetical protein